MNTENQTKNDGRRWIRTGRIGVVLTISAVVALSACGSDNNSTSTSSAKISCASGSVQGAGSTFVQPIAQQWVKDYQAGCTGATVNYRGVGSGTGITQFTEGAVDFAATDVQLKDSESAAANAKWGEVVSVPWAAGAVALEYKLTGVEEVRLSPATIAGIFSGSIKTWDAAEISADNAGRKMPNTPIQVMHRSDGSGTTAVFTEFLTANAPEVWKAGSGKEITWPAGQGLKGSDTLTAAVKQTEGAIGYAELSFAKANALQTVKVKNAAAEFVGPDAKDAVTAALAEWGVDAGGKSVANYKPQSANAYPISSFTYVIVPKGNGEKQKLMQSFITYAVGDGQKSAEPLSYAPLPESVVSRVKDKVASLAAQ